MKKYIAPACEIMNLATEQMLAVSFNLNSDKTTTTQLSNHFVEAEDEWDE